MDVSLFDFELPEDRVALRPAAPRDAARLLVVRSGEQPELLDHVVSDLPGLLRPGDVLVVNDTRVIPARLTGRRYRGEASAGIEATLVRRLDAARWRALARPAKRLEPGDRVRFGDQGESAACLLGALDATVEARGEGGEVDLAFDLAGPDLDLAIMAAGAIPLPPYILSKRDPDALDVSDYQTLFAKVSGAVAAPTAGLHFTEDLVRRLQDKGIAIQAVTLHVGAGTFLPVKAEDTADHRMHAEWGTVSATTAEALNAARDAGGRIVAVGTTALRVLETAAGEDGRIRAWTGDTDIFIMPGHRFLGADVLLTNFHLPRSTLFMLVAAFSGLERMRHAYAHALSRDYRFYSYGDACLLFRDPAIADAE